MRCANNHTGPSMCARTIICACPCFACISMTTFNGGERLSWIRSGAKGSPLNEQAWTRGQSCDKFTSWAVLIQYSSATNESTSRLAESKWTTTGEISWPGQITWRDILRRHANHPFVSKTILLRQANRPFVWRAILPFVWKPILLRAPDHPFVWKTILRRKSNDMSARRQNQQNMTKVFNTNFVIKFDRFFLFFSLCQLK